MHDPETNTLAMYVGPASASPEPRLLPYTDARVAAGFPVPTVDFEQDDLDLGALLVPKPLASFLYKAAGNSMVLDGVLDGDFLLVDRSLDPVDGSLVIASWDGCQPVCKRLRLVGDRVILESRNPHHKAIELPAGTEVEVFCVRSVARIVRND